MEDQKEKKPALAFKPRDGGLFPQRQKPSPAAERAAKAALLRSRLSVDSPRASSLGRGSFIRGGRLVRGGRSAGAAAAAKTRSTALGGPPPAFPFGQTAAAASNQGAGVTQEAASADQGDKAQENTQAQKQACRPHSGRAGGRPQSNALFNISAHLGLGGAAASRTLSPPKNRPQVSGLTKPARAMRMEGCSAATASQSVPDSNGNEDDNEMTEEQSEAERRAALASMPTFGGGQQDPEAAKPQTFPSALGSATEAQTSVLGFGSDAGQQGTLGGNKPKSDFAFGMKAASAAAAGKHASAPQTGAVLASGQQSMTGGAKPKLSFGFGMPAPSAAAAAEQYAIAPQAGSQQAAWPGLNRTQPLSADASAPANQQASPAGIFGRLANGSAPLSRLSVPQQAPQQQGASQPGDAAAKMRRSQRFGNNAGPSAEAAFFASIPQSSGAGEDVGAMDDDGGGALKGTIVGTCEDMCPHVEIMKRCNIEDVPIFERPDPHVANTTTELAVKKFSRNVEQTPENFRTMGALRRTMVYLRSIMDRQDMPLVNIHKYLWDRFRAVRQDLFVQGFEGPEAIVMYEEHIRFMIMAEHELSEETTAAADQEAFNSHLNLEQINKALISLNAMYDKQRCAGQEMPCEAEFRAYHLLTLIGTHGKYRYDGTEYQGALASLSEEIFYSEDVERVVQMQLKLGYGNWAAFFQLATNATYLQGCLAHMYFQGVRARAVNAIAAAGLPARGSDPPAVCFPAGDLQHRLYLNSPEDVLEFGEKADLATDEMTDAGSFATSVYLPKNVRFTEDSVPRRRCHAISAKADELRSTVSQGLQGLTPEELQARQLRQQQLQQQLAQQQAQRVQEQQKMQAKMQQEQQRQRAEEAARQAAELAACQKAAETEAARQAIAAKEAELRRQQAEREQAQLRQQREQKLRAQQEAARLAEQQRKAAEEHQRQLHLEQQHQQQLCLEQERRTAELKAQQEAEEARRREEARWQAELTVRRREQERMRKQEEERQRRAAELRHRQEEGLRAVAHKRRRRLARQAAIQWRKVVAKAREDAEQERRTLEALANVHVGIRATPFRIHWPSHASQEQRVASAIAQHSSITAAPSLDTRAAIGPALARQMPAMAEVHWKLMMLHYDGPEHVDAVFRLREELSHRSAQCDGHVLALDSFTMPHEGPAGERLVSVAVCDASKSLASSEAMCRAVLGSSGMLLLVTDRDDPAVVDRRLSALYAACKQKIPLLVLTSGIPNDAIATFVQQLLASQSSLADGVAAHKVLRLPESTSASFPEVLSQGLQWLASEAPSLPALMSVPLRQIVLHQLQASIGASDSAAATLQDTMEACNTSLSAATSLMSEAGTRAAAAWGWPPPETCTGDHSIPAGWYRSEHKGRLRNALDRLRLPPMPAQDCGHGAAGSVGATEGFPAYMQEVFGTHDTRLEPRSTMRSAFQQRLQALDSPQMLSAVISQGSWPPKDAISRCESSFQLAAPMSPTGSGSSSVVRKRKGYSILSDRGRPPRKSKAEGSPGWSIGSPDLSASAISPTVPHDIFADVPKQASSSPSRPAQETMHHLQRVKRDLAAQMEANKRLAGPSLQLSATKASSSVEGDVQQSASSA